MLTGRRFWTIAFVLVVICVLPGCGGVNWSVTPYAGVYGNTDDDYNDGIGWQGGISLTLSNGRPAVPAVIHPPSFYRNDTRVENQVSSSSNSNSSATQSQTQNQSQSQEQNQNQDQRGGNCSQCGHRQHHGRPCGGGGDDGDGNHGHGNDDDHDDDDNPGHGHGHDDDDYPD